jgi:radical SAM superfamily enzyme YgiQ (UPF0313 family)
MKFLLLRSEGCDDIDSRGSVYSPSFLPPLSLMYIGAALEHAGHKVEIVDLAVQRFSKELLKKSLKSVDAVGMSVYTDNYKDAAEIAKMIKEIDHDISIIIGGPHCIFLEDQSLRDIPHADICVVGEGEKVITDIALFLQGKKDLSQINGIYYQENKKIKKGKPVQVIDDLNSVYFPARHLAERYDYGKLGKKFLFKPRLTSIITSRGCPFKCRFCARYSTAIKGWGNRIRSAENVLKEFQEIDGKYNTVMIVDDNFTLDKKRVHSIMDGLIEMDSDIELLIMGSRVDSADRDLYEKMKKANVKLIAYGIESGNQDVLDFYRKGFTIEQARKAIFLAREMNFKTVATFILGAPIETKEHFDKTINFACSLPLDMAIFGVLHYEMGSDLWRDAVNNNKLSKDEFLVAADSIRGLGNFPKQYLYEYTDMGHKRFYLRPTFITYQVFRALVNRDFGLLRNGLNFIRGSD